MNSCYIVYLHELEQIKDDFTGYIIFYSIFDYWKDSWLSYRVIFVDNVKVIYYFCVAVTDTKTLSCILSRNINLIMIGSYTNMTKPGFAVFTVTILLSIAKVYIELHLRTVIKELIIFMLSSFQPLWHLQFPHAKDTLFVCQL